MDFHHHATAQRELDSYPPRPQNPCLKRISLRHKTPQSTVSIQRTIPLKKPVKKTAKKTSAKRAPAKKSKAKPIKKSTAKKTIKKFVKAPVKKVAKKTVKAAVRKAVRKVAKKPTSKKTATRKTSVAAKRPVKVTAKITKVKTIKLGVNRVVVTDGKITAKKLTKTAERKASRAAKAAKIAPKVKAKAIRIAKPVWPPLVEVALRCLDDAKAEDVITIDLTGKSTLADTMIVASGRSNRHVNAIADQLMEQMKKHGQHNLRVEGIPQCDWVVVDAGDILLHIFRPEVRSFYNLEKLWSAHVPE
jgi:ribosome-associated protein